MSSDFLVKMSPIEDEGEIEVDDEEEEPGSLDTSYSSDGGGGGDQVSKYQVTIRDGKRYQCSNAH